MDHSYIERVVDLTEPEANRLYRLSVAEAKEIVLHGSAEEVGRIAGSFALVAREGKKVRLARSLDRPLRYFLAKRQEGPVLIVAARIDTIFDSGIAAPSLFDPATLQAFNRRFVFAQPTFGIKGEPLPGLVLLAHIGQRSRVPTQRPQGSVRPRRR